MKRYAALIVLAIASAATPCQAQFLKQLEQGLLGGQGQPAGQQQILPGQQAQATFVGNVNLPPGQYMISNVQNGQAFYVSVQNGQMFLSAPPAATSPQMVPPGQGTAQGMVPGQTAPQQGIGGTVINGVGNFLKNEFLQRQAPAPSQ